MTVDPVSLAAASLGVSGPSLILSTTNACLTLLKPGIVKMVRPPLVAFMNAPGDGPKVWVRALLYSTSARGNVVESLYVRLRRGGSEQTFSFWACGERDQLVSGCGLYVGREGVTSNHHFLLPWEERGRTEFVAGEYELSVYATLVGQSRKRSLCTLQVVLSEGHASALAPAGAACVCV